MKKLNKHMQIAAYLLIICVVFLISCRDDSAQFPEPNNISSTEPGPETSTEEVAVTVNGVNIPEARIQQLLDEIVAVELSGVPLQIAEQLRPIYRTNVLNELIRSHLMDEKIQEAGITISEEQAISEIEKGLASLEPPASLDKYKESLIANNQSFEEVVQQYQQILAYQEFLNSEGMDQINVTEEQAKRYYDENQSEFEEPEKVKVRHILIMPDSIDPNENNINKYIMYGWDESDPNTNDTAAKAMIKDLFEQIKGGADFGELAKEYSHCGSAPDGGVLPYYSRARLDPAFAEIAFELEKDELSDIVESSFGYHIIKGMDHRDARTLTFDEAKDDLITRLAGEQKTQFAQKYMENLVANADIVYPPGKEPQQPAQAEP